MNLLGAHSRSDLQTPIHNPKAIDERMPSPPATSSLKQSSQTFVKIRKVEPCVEPITAYSASIVGAHSSRVLPSPKSPRDVRTFEG